MSRSSNKANRLLQVEAILLAHPEGLTPAELARKLQVNRSTVGRYLDDLPRHIYLDELDGGKWKIDREGYLVNVRFNLHEALAVHLAARLLATRLDRQNPHAAAALRKLGVSLERLAPQISQHIKQSADLMDDASRFQDPRYVQVLEKLALAWAERRKIRLWHRYEKTGAVNEYIFAPYFIEPYAIGQTTHVIGWRHDVDAIRTFKIERIERIEEIKNPPQFYEIPPDFDPRRLLADAWGIWYTESAPQQVTLLFKAGLPAARAQETLWHTSQKPDLLPDGRLRWQALIAEPKEMLPWIRGWGADVEVLEPASLREEVSLHVHKMAVAYGLTIQENDSTSRLCRLWGKTTKNSDIFHPALYHMLDVAHIAQQLLRPPASPRWRQVLARALNADAGALADWLPWFIALHDIGKISVPFQVQNDLQKQRLRSENFTFGDYTTAHKELHHTLMGRMVLKEWAKSFPYTWRTVFLDMVAGHHGAYQQPEGEHNALYATLREPEEWAQLRQQALDLLRQHLLLKEPSTWPEPTNISAAIVALNGFTILCDWLGSDEDYFTPRPYTPLPAYLAASRQKAHERLQSAGFFAPAYSPAPTSFAELFHWSPRPLQKAIDHIPDHLLAEPTLTIIEAPTGEGKTEAALALAHRIARQQGTDEMYLALPTTATSNAMFTRLQEHLQQRLQLPSTLVQLVHGQSFLQQDDLRITPLENGDDKPHPALTWFEPKKKSLLAPFGVGTVDQAELAALNVRHNALRLIGLAGKVVILDEVHAYDTYMTTIIARMLEWLAAMGSSVILLSATLPTARREQLAAAYTGGQVVLEKTDAYPYLLTVNRAACYSANPSAAETNRTIFLHTLHFAEADWAGKAAWLLAQTENGGCVCWIANTVERAQRTFQALQQLAPDDVDCALLHTRFPLSARQRKTEEIQDKYSKDSARRPRKGVVIGTQVLEQSLDIDFDLMVSDLAPIDLLLQRMGRLHRHQRSDRPATHSQPHMYVNYELDHDQQLHIGDDRFYTPYILLKTWQIVAPKAAAGQLNLPQDYRPLIEAVYDQASPAPGSLLHDAWTKRRQKESKLEGEANLRLTNAPDPEDPFYEGDKRLWREDEESAAWIVAQTRYQERESVTVIPIEWIDEDTGQIPGVGQLFLQQAVDRDTQLLLLQNSVRLSHPELVKQIKAQTRPPLFTASPLLNVCYPLWLQQGYGIGLPVRLDPDLGLLIEKE
ncbi:MAG: hypothetical protein Fur0021_41010 [Candidatus Promineifilaceae bacterium]